MQLTIGADVTVERDAILNSPALKRWRNKLHSGWQLLELHVYAVKMWGRVIAQMLVRATVVDHRGRTLTSMFYLRGRVVDVTAVVSVNGRQYLLAVEQSRVAAGGPVIANVSGFVEGEPDVEAARRELDEELKEKFDWTIQVLNHSVVGSDEAWLVSPGGIDEEVVFCIARATITPEQLEALRGREAGLAAEGEFTVVHPVPIEEAPGFLARFAGGSRADLKAVTGITIAQYLAFI